MYDLPSLRPATDGWWAGIAGAAGRHGLDAVPSRLERREPVERVWHAPDLLLSQCCGRDLVTHLAGIVVPVAIPIYNAPGCARGSYCSWLIVRDRDPRRELADLAGAIAAINYVGSHSGWVALAHSLAMAGLPERCLARGVLTGSHRASIGAVARGIADLAAIDCVSFALLAREEPDLVGAVRILGASEPAPALPYITSAGRSPAECRALAAALDETASTDAHKGSRAALLIEGFVPAADAFARTVAMAEAALSSPCAELHHA
jgi:ABC-type phosphate/phosphonate transport system substrate-binding protein